MKSALLFLCHRIPYPPNKGDKIRSFHLLKHLARRHRIFLGAFIDDPTDWEHAGALSEWCEETHFLKLDPRLGRLKSLQGFLSGEPLTLPYYRDSGMARWVSEVIGREAISNILIYSSAMAQYADINISNKINKIIDFVDVDSDKWRQYSSNKKWPMNWIYRREADRLLAYERKIADLFSASLFVSSMEAALFKTLAPESASKISYYSNGVDLESFSPEIVFQDPYQGPGPHLVFTGAMDYWPNADAVAWFVEQVLPAARMKWPTLEFHIVGSHPTEQVRDLAQIDGVEVTGRVPDVRPYLSNAKAVIASMRIARGIQNKVLEAMAMARPVIVSPMGLEGIDAQHGSEILVADVAEDYIDALNQIMSGKQDQMGAQARIKVLKQFSWATTLPRIDEWLI